MKEETFLTIMPGQALSIEELSNIRGGAIDKPNKDESAHACTSSACSSNIENVSGFCQSSVCVSQA